MYRCFFIPKWSCWIWSAMSQVLHNSGVAFWNWDRLGQRTCEFTEPTLPPWECLTMSLLSWESQVKYFCACHQTINLVVTNQLDRSFFSQPLHGRSRQDLKKLTQWHGMRPAHEQKRFLRNSMCTCWAPNPKCGEWSVNAYACLNEWGDEFLETASCFILGTSVAEFWSIVSLNNELTCTTA